jgi:N-ATPase, AtpR subunit
MNLMTLLTVALFGGIGGALGLAHFHGLYRDARGYVTRGPTPGGLALHAARIAATALLLLFIALHGAIPLLAALAGFLAARFVAVAVAPRSA